MGHSAGAQIATLLALDPVYLHAQDVAPDTVCGVVGLAGPYDFLPLHDPELETIFGPEAERPRSQPINYVTPQAPPMLLLAGRDDTTVDPGNTLRLAAKLRGAGVSVQSGLYPRIGHAPLIGAFAWPLGFLAPARKDTIDFVQAHGRCGS
jgi:acetyl esterase/lipase